MTRITVLAFFLIYLLVSCDENSTSVFSIGKIEFEKNISDSMYVYMDNDNVNLNFTGHLKLTDGNCELLLISALADTVFEEYPEYDYDTTWVVNEINFDTIDIDGNRVVVTDTSWLIDEIYIADSILLVDTLLFYNDSIFYENYTAPVDIDLEEVFDPFEGYWQFYYTVYPDPKNMDVAPLGEFEFVFQYTD